MILIILLLFLCRASAVIYQLNETEFNRMPPVIYLDPYNLCIQENGGTYCAVDINLVSDDDSSLLKMIKEYSERNEAHFNHLLLYHGICVSKSCKDYIPKHYNNESVNLRQAIERCLNDTFWKEYKLKTRIGEEIICNDMETEMVLEPADIAVAVLILSLIVINIAGSLYDTLVVKNDDFIGFRWLLCFSIRRNWKKLTSLQSDNANQRVERLKGLSGLRAIMIAAVLIEHALLPFVISTDNVLALETIYNKVPHHILIDGTVVVQTFFVLSGCLLAYHLQIHSEKETITWRMIPKSIILRWLRLTPSYAVVLAFSVTWLRFAGSGPLWHMIVYPEVTNCRKYGWQNLLYMNNVFDNPLCIPPTWYLANDMQLFIIGTVTLMLVKSNRARSVVLSIMFVASILLIAFRTYFHNLQAHVILSPEIIRTGFVHDPTFNYSYKKPYMNLSCYVIGLALGLLIYHLQQKEFDVEKYKKYKYLIWATGPATIALIVCCSLLYMKEEESPLIVKAIFSGIFRASFGILVLIFILGVVFKIENICRPVLEWQGWTTLARVSYSTYIIHLFVLKIIIGSRTTLTTATFPEIILTCTGITFTSFLLAYPFWLLVEAPVTQLVKVMTSGGKKITKKPKLDNE